MTVRRAARHPRASAVLVLVGVCALAAVAVALTRGGGTDYVAAPRGPVSPSVVPAPTPTLLPPGRHEVVAVGDSVPYGSACGCPPYVMLVADGLARRLHTTVHATNLAVPGETSGGVLVQLRDPNVRAVLARADMLIVTVGANDFDESRITQTDCRDPGKEDCFGAGLRALRRTLGDYLTAVQGMIRPGGVVLVTGYWNVFLDGRVGRANGRAYVTNSDALTRAVNTVLAGVAKAQQATFVDLYAPFKAEGDDTHLLAPDGDHPDAEGHEVIAGAVLEALG